MYIADECIATGNGLNGPIEVTVTFDVHKIVIIKIGAHSGTPGISDPAFNTIPAVIIENQPLAIAWWPARP